MAIVTDVVTILETLLCITFVFCYTVLGGIELEILATVEDGDTISDLAAELDHSESYLSRAVATLTDTGLVYTTSDGRRKRVAASDARAVEIFRDLVRQHPHIDFPELLTGKAIEVLYYLDQPRTVAEIADLSDNYRNTVNRILKRFRDQGLVGTDDARYTFNGDFDQLHAFARELVHHRHRKHLESLTLSGSIIWEGYDEFLFQSETPVDADHVHETGLARFAAFDLQFILTSTHYYFYSDSMTAVPPTDLCCHTLLIDDGPRHQSYCLLLLSHVDVDERELRDRAATYELDDTIDTLLRYLETAGDVNANHLPQWPEFQALAADYDVTLTP